MSKLLQRRRLLACLLLSGIAPQALAAGDDSKKNAESEAPAAVGCGKEVVGNWLIEFDAYAYRVMSPEAEVSWNVKTALDPVTTTGVYMHMDRPRRTTGGFLSSSRMELWLNAPDVEMSTSHGKSYHAFGSNLGHSYSRSVGFGSRRLWKDDNEFWYPKDDKFNCKIVQTNAKTAQKFEKALTLVHEAVRVELYAPMFSLVDHVAHGDVVDTEGFIAAAKIAMERSDALYEEHAECSVMTEPDFLPPEKEGCFLTTAAVLTVGLADDCWELTQLRDFRDRVLKRTPSGRALVEDYYNRAPAMVDKINARPDADRIWRKTWAFGVVPSAIAARLGFEHAALRLYRSMLERLERLAI